ncbi:hypothetical protein Tco_1063263, partial [Tanacetum coccineum]
VYEDETIVLESLNVQKPKQADQPRKVSQNPRNNNTSWNTPMPKKLGFGFQFTPKACFVCGSFNHLIKDCDFHDKRMVQKPVLNNVKKGTSQREVRPVWTNAMRVNHQNFSNSRRNFAPTAVLTKFGLVPFSTARQSFSRTTVPKQKILKSARLQEKMEVQAFMEIFKHCHDLDLWGDLRIIFDPNEEDDIWLNQQYWELLRWKLHEYSGVHYLFLDGTSIQINMLVEKKYPLKKAILEKMINLK